MNWEEQRRLLAVCTQCSSVYAAVELSDGSVQPIGRRKGCASCGADDFKPIEEQGIPSLSGPETGDDDD